MEPSPLPLDTLHDGPSSPSTSNLHPPHSPPTPTSQSRLPQGQCQAILVSRGATSGYRCPCTHFTLNSTSPAIICDCGHMSCYHAVEHHSFEKSELRRLQEQVRLLDEQLRRDHQSSSVDLLARLSLLEEHVERNYDDLDQRLKESNGRFGCVWQQVDTLEKRGREIMHTLPLHAHQMKALETRVDTNYSKLAKSTQALDQRIMCLESNELASSNTGSPSTLNQSSTSTCPSRPQQREQDQQHDQDYHQDQRRRQRQRQQMQIQHMSNHQPFERQQLQSSNSSSPHIQYTPNIAPARNSRPTSTILPAVEAPRRDDSNPPRQTLQPVSIKFPITSSLPESWTVHVSLLPNRFQPFPFEKDTRAYKRCLSRGLHRCVVVSDHNAAAFNRAVTDAFGALLCGRSWMPLQAKLCDVHDLQGLPMLRQLDPSLQGMPYDLGFLRTHCAVLCPGGKLDSLYIAMKDDILSWEFLRQCDVFMSGLDSSWEPDQYLDSHSGTVGDLGLGAPLKKRTASEISRAPTIAISTTAPPSTSQVSIEDTFTRAKISRATAVLGKVSEVPRVVETI
ncbi:hypothetical protein Cpir12675_001710 [Ceratocystis pirilliformis]|uniref:Uncharacterized protein n=1 Tax=Ceratocystis pirilliformis TaxID=259994 RepID=A0ABR3ZF82_9PEZI